MPEEPRKKLRYLLYAALQTRKNFVVLYAAVERRQDRASLIIHHRQIRRRASELAYGVHRIPERLDDKLDTVALDAPQQICSSAPGQRRQARQYGFGEVGRIEVRAIELGSGAPDSRDHLARRRLI